MTTAISAGTMFPPGEESIDPGRCRWTAGARVQTIRWKAFTAARISHTASTPLRPAVRVLTAAEALRHGRPRKGYSRSCGGPGIEHSPAASFAPTSAYFDSENIVSCHEADAMGGFDAAARIGLAGTPTRSRHMIQPTSSLIPNSFESNPFRDVKQAFDLGGVGVGATIYFGRGIQAAAAGTAGVRSTTSSVFTVLWCYMRKSLPTKDALSPRPDLTVHPIILADDRGGHSQRASRANGGFDALKVRKPQAVYSQLSRIIRRHPGTACECYMGRSVCQLGGRPHGQAT